MRLVNTILVASAAAFVIGGLSLTGVAQMDDATTKPAATTGKATAAKAKPAKAIKLVQPWSKVTDLTDEQKQKLFDIHEDYKAKMKALDAEEEAQSNAVLTDAQKAQLQEALEADKASRKTKAAEKKTGGAEAKPAD